MNKCKKILIISIIGIVISTLIINSNVYAWCNTVTAKKDITAARLTLSNGTELHNITLEKGLVNVTSSTSLKDLKIYFLIDTSNSMNSSLSSIKSSMNSFVDNIYSFYGDKSNQIQIAVVGFDEETATDAGNINLYTNVSDVKNEIFKLNIDASHRDIEQAAELTLSSMSPANNNNLLQVAIFITDCDIKNVTNEMAESATISLKDISMEKMALMYACSINTPFNNTVAGDILAGVPEVIPIEIQDVISFWVPETTNGIKGRVVDFSTVMPSVSSTTANSFTTIGNDIILFADDELLHGALLEVEYLITASRGCSVTDYIDPNFTFTTTNHLITNPNETNDTYGWHFNSALAAATANGRNQYKIVLSTVLTPTTIPNNGYNNIAICDFSGYRQIRVASGVVKIFPPFGAMKNSVSENFYLIALTVSISSLIFVIILIIAVKNKLNRKAK